MKILFVGMRWEHGDKNQGSSFEYDLLYRALEHYPGTEMASFDFLSLYQEKGKEKMNELLLSRVAKIRPDLVFFVLYRNEFFPETIKKLSADPAVLTFNWFCDDDWRWESFSRQWAPCFNFVGTTTRATLPKYQATGCQNAIFTPWAVNHFYQKLNLSKKYDVSFVGMAHTNRKRTIKELEKKGIKVACWGRFWPPGRLSTRRMIRIINQSKINLGFNTSSARLTLGTRLPWWFYPKMACHSSDQVNARNFEVPGGGGFLLTSWVKGLDEFYRLNKEIAVYENFEELVEKIRYYLKHEEEREAIALAGYKRTLKDHTYEKRFQKIFRKMGLKLT